LYCWMFVSSLLDGCFATAASSFLLAAFCIDVFFLSEVHSVRFCGGGYLSYCLCFFCCFGRSRLLTTFSMVL
jgi:hypothetical protein